MASGNVPVHETMRSRLRGGRGRRFGVAAPVRSADLPLFSSPPSDLSINDQEEIDRGAYGSVYTGELAGNPVAVKRIHPVLLQAESVQGRRVRQDFKAECQRLKDIGDHPNVVGFLGAYQDGKGPFLVMEKMSQNLQRFLETNRESLRLQHQMQLCLDIATGLEFLHSQSPPVVHRDLSAKNVLLDEAGRAKIGDLGQSKLKKDSHFETRQPGAIPYMPPEALRAQPLYNEKVDIFSFGVLMLEIATQSAPSVSLEGINTIPEEDRRRSDLALLPEDHPLKPLVCMCLKDDPAERPDAAIIREILQGLYEQLAQASNSFTQAKRHFSTAIEPLEESHRKVVLLANEAESPECEHLRGLSTGRMGEILKLVRRSEMKVVFFGRTSNGKSTVINALLKSKVLPFGAGSTTTAICYIRGQDTPGEGGFVKCDDDDSCVVPVQSADELDCHMEGQRVVQIYWSTAQCSMLKGDIVLVDCPGMNAESETDAEVIECCSDADVFVYVASGFTTLETAERELLVKVKENISSPSNTFILFNHWDRVLEEGEKKASKVKQQQLGKVTRIMVEELGIFTEEMVEERTFFVSAKQAVECAVSAQQIGGHLQQEFNRFEKLLQECLFEEAIRTKLGRHYSECQPIVAAIKTALPSMKCKWMKERKTAVKDKERRELVIADIDVELQHFDQMYGQTVMKALEEVDAMCDKFHSSIKEKLCERINNFKPKEAFDPKKVDQYCKDMEEHLLEKLNEETDTLMKQWTVVTTGVVQTMNGPLLQLVEDNRLGAGEARFGGQNIPSTLHSKLHPSKLSKEASKSSVAFGAGAGAGAGAVAGTFLALGVKAVPFVVAMPIAAAVGAVGLGTLFYARWKSKIMNEDKAKLEIHKEVIGYMDKQKDERKEQCRDALKEHVKASTNAVYMDVEKKKRELEETVDRLKGELKDLRTWLREAGYLEVKVVEMESQLNLFKGQYL